MLQQHLSSCGPTSTNTGLVSNTLLCSRTIPTPQSPESRYIRPAPFSLYTGPMAVLFPPGACLSPVLPKPKPAIWEEFARCVQCLGEFLPQMRAWVSRSIEFSPICWPKLFCWLSIYNCLRNCICQSLLLVVSSVTSKFKKKMMASPKS